MFGGAGGRLRGFDDPGGLARWLGRMPTWMAMLVLAAFAVLGVIFSLILGQEPGAVLGFFIIVGTIIAAICIKHGRVYMLFPAPALAFFIAAILAGKVHDAKLGSSTAGLGAGFTQWVAGIFFPAVVATILVLLIGGGRWLLGRQLVTTGQGPLSPARVTPRPARPAPGSRRPAVDEWAEDEPFADSAAATGQTGPAPKQGAGRPTWMGNPSDKPRPSRPPRDQRTDRDQWGDPRGPADRKQPTAPRPNQGSGPRPNQGTGARPNQGSGPRPNQGSGPRPNQGANPNQGSGPRPNQGTGARPAQGTGSRPRPNGGQPQPRAPRPSFNPSANPAPPTPQRPRRQPPENWTR
jgi:hypothetical protein